MADDAELQVDLIVDAADQVTLTLWGEVDLATKAVFVAALEEAAAAGATTVVLDLAGVPFLDSSGLGAIVDAVAAGASIVVRQPQPVVRRVFEVVVIDGLTLE